MDTKFKALVSRYIDETKVAKNIELRDIDDLPKHDTLIKVEYSSLNYKDTLSANGHKGITRNYPHTPGIDAAGVVVKTEGNKFQAGDKVVVTGYDLGMNTSGGFAEYIRVPEEWIVPLPTNIPAKEAMIYGTAGFTAATAIFEFQKHGLTPESGKVLVTGATGGVGTLAIAMLAKMGYKVVASTGKTDLSDYLRKLGASEIIHRDEINDKSGKPLLEKQWIASLDNVGGNTLATILRSTLEYGIVCNCGMVEGTVLNTNVFPFILRGVRLVGIASAETPMRRRLEIWDKIFNEYRLEEYNFNIKEVTLEELPSEIDLMAKGKHVGRILVKVSN